MGKWWFFLSVVLSASLFACSPAQKKVDPERRRTLVFDFESRVVTPDLWNPFVPGTRQDQGLHQSMIEPLFMLNPENNEIEPWLALSMTPNPTLDVWTLNLRPGVVWSDGEAFNADDVVFTVEMLLANAPSLIFSAALKQWINARVGAKFQRVAAVKIIKDFPRNVAGKTLKREMRDAYAGR